ncbi:putative malate dehydrogenase [Helianthus anomalus]
MNPLYDVNVPGVTAIISHMDTRVVVRGFLRKAFTGVDLVIISAAGPRMPGMTRISTNIIITKNPPNLFRLLENCLRNGCIANNIIDLLALMRKDENSILDVEEVIFPLNLNKLIGKMFAFIIEITTYNLTNFDEMYVVTNMTDDESIINELKEKMNITKNLSKEKVIFQALRVMMLIPVLISIKSTSVNWLTSTTLQLQVTSKIRRKLVRKRLNSYIYEFKAVFMIFTF